MCLIEVFTFMKLRKKEGHNLHFSENVSMFSSTSTNIYILSKVVKKIIFDRKYKSDTCQTHSIKYTTIRTKAEGKHDYKTYEDI